MERRGDCCTSRLTFRAELDFQPNDFPGYSHFRTLPHASLLGQGNMCHEGKRGDNNSMNITTVGCVDAADEDVQSGARTLIFQLPS